MKTIVSRKVIKITNTIVINKSVESVFAFFANPANDKLWRTEINDTQLNEPLKLGVLVAEYSNLSKRASNTLIVLKCTKFDKNKIAIFETLQNAKFYLKTKRQVKSLSQDVTEITYTIYFDNCIVKWALGFALPKCIISLKANRDMKKYLLQLKTKLETV